MISRRPHRVGSASTRSNPLHRRPGRSAPPGVPVLAADDPAHSRAGLSQSRAGKPCQRTSRLSQVMARAASPRARRSSPGPRSAGGGRTDRALRTRQPDRSESGEQPARHRRLRRAATGRVRSPFWSARRRLRSPPTRTGWARAAMRSACDQAPTRRNRGRSVRAAEAGARITEVRPPTLPAARVTRFSGCAGAFVSSSRMRIGASLKTRETGAALRRRDALVRLRASRSVGECGNVVRTSSPAAATISSSVASGRA
jgi:hypothetical protein